MTPRPIIFPLLLWLCIVFGLITLLLAAGCAPVPLCERYSVMLGQDQNGRLVYAMDIENAAKMAEMVKGLQAGTCRIQLEGEV